MDWTNKPEYVVAVISAASGLIGVVLGGFITSITAFTTARTQRGANAKYLAVMVVGHLDRFTRMCLAITQDDGIVEEYGEPPKEELRSPAPTFDPLTFDVDWKSLDQLLTYRIFQIPYQLERVQAEIAAETEYADFDAYVDVRRKAFAKFGQEVAAIASKLRWQGGLPQDPEWAERVKQLKAVQKMFKDREERWRKLDEEDQARRASVGGAITAGEGQTLS